MAEKLRWLNENCSFCGRQMNSWDLRLTKKFLVKPTCEKCFCETYGMKEDAFRRRMEEYFSLRPCQGI